MSRPVPRVIARALAAGAVASLSTAAAAPPAFALSVPLDPANPEVSESWVNSAVRTGEGEVAELSLLDGPTAVHDEAFHVKLSVTNRSGANLDGLTITPRRGPVTGSVLDQRVASVASISEYALAGNSRRLASTLAPGESIVVELTIEPDELPLPGFAAYPLLFELADSDGATLDTERFHLASRAEVPEGVQPGGLTALYPITAPIDILPGETGEAPEDPQLVLASDELAAQIAPGGRLDQLVNTYTEAAANPEVASATCVALDPALIDTVDRMTHGYIVADERAPVVEEPKRLRDSWGDTSSATRGTPGAGANDAEAWLEKVRTISENNCTVALPWANADINAVVRTGDPWMVREAIERGPFVLARVLGTTGTTNLVVPSAGYVTPDAVPALGWADHSRSTIPSEGLSGAWERAVANAKSDSAAGGAQSDGSRSALERADAAAPAWAAAPAPEKTVQVLVPSGSINSETDDRFAWIDPGGVMAVRYQDSLASTLAIMGERPTTVGYSNDSLRFDYSMDSKLARDINAAAGVQLAAQMTWSTGSTGSPATSAEQGMPGAQQEPMLIRPPATWDAESAETILTTVAELFSAGAATPLPLAEYLAPSPSIPVPTGENLGTVYSDPTVFTDSEVLNATQQACFINDLSALFAPDPSIALTRYGFTLPLRRDILTALSPDGRQSIASYNQAVSDSAARMSGSRGTLGELRSAVNLIPPGNVYTRTSPSSPLLIVAQNGMPLPVDTAILYTAPEGARLNVPASLRIPARGSVTVQMTADLPQEARGTDLQLYLAGPQGHAISQPVEISVRTPSSAVQGWVLIATGAVGFALLLLYSVGKRYRRNAAARAQSPPQEAAHLPTRSKTTRPANARKRSNGQRRDSAG